jgi:predicted dehydrogenase
MKIAVIGCGYVSDFYISTLENYPNLHLCGVYDHHLQRAECVCKFFKTHMFRSLDEILDSPTIDLVVNLTSVASHYDISKQSLEAGKHVYSEKPLAANFLQAKELVDLAKSKGLILSGAPCSILSETAQTLLRALRKGKIGTPHLVYANLDDGPVYQTNMREWRNNFGAHWPYKEEFEVGCTLEHAAYYISWLVAFFGPVKKVTSFSTVIIQDKNVEPQPMGNDWSVGCLEFANGVIARITCGLLAKRDHSLHIFGDSGTLMIRDCWDYGAKVYIGRINNVHKTCYRAIPPIHIANFKRSTATRMDYARGINEVAKSLMENRPCKLNADFLLHINEIVFTLNDPAGMQSPRELTTAIDWHFEPMT